jgi:ribose-phosphate pyrophosphokinase
MNVAFAPSVRPQWPFAAQLARPVARSARYHEERRHCRKSRYSSIRMVAQESPQSSAPPADGPIPAASAKPPPPSDLPVVLSTSLSPSAATSSDSEHGKTESQEGDMSSVDVALERRAAVSFGSHRMKVFSGSSNPSLSTAVARYVGKSTTSAILRKQFADNESYVRIEESVRGCNVFLVQSTSNPVNDTLIELLIMIDACRRAHAHQITAVIPYYGYSRADRLIDADKRRREALTSKLVANMLCAAGTDRVVVVDIHSPQTCGFFDIPVDHIYACSVLVEYLNKKNLQDVVVVAPDVGGVGRARAFAKHAGDAPLAIIDKRRDGHNMSTVLNLVGDVKGKTAVLVDDMIDTAGTICNAAAMLRERGARQVFAVATHPVFSGKAVERLSSGVFEEVIVCDTIYIPPSRRFPQLTVLSVAALIGEQIWRVHEQSSR